MTDELLNAFRAHYAGRHDPDDALWWLDHPDEVGPSTTPPPHWTLLRAAEELDEFGQSDAALALLESAAEVIAVDRRAALHALHLAQQTLLNGCPGAP